MCTGRHREHKAVALKYSLLHLIFTFTSIQYTALQKTVLAFQLSQSHLQGIVPCRMKFSHQIFSPSLTKAVTWRESAIIRMVTQRAVFCTYSH
jgi:hypothetical protein